MISVEELNKVKEEILSNTISKEELEIIKEKINKEIDEIISTVDDGSDPIDE